MNVVPWYSYWSQVAQISTPIIATIGFVLIGRQIKVAREQAQAGKEAAEAAGEQARAAVATLEHMKNNISPRLVLTPTYGLHDAKRGVYLTVENFGSSMAVCYFLSLRNDLKTASAYDLISAWRNKDFSTDQPEEQSRVRDYAINANGRVVFFLPAETGLTIDVWLHSSLRRRDSSTGGRLTM
ncbi:MAG: hypothetical protein OWU32_14095 [Firmicutes bacterium]|nr:hypothetical protein [Bacillota bacterium]